MSKHLAVGRKNSFQNKIQAQGGAAIYLDYLGMREKREIRTLNKTKS